MRGYGGIRCVPSANAPRVDARLLSALEDVADNDGVMWRAESGFEAETLWRRLRSEGLVRFDPWTGGNRPSDVGERVLAGRRR